MVSVEIPRETAIDSQCLTAREITTGVKIYEEGERGRWNKKEIRKETTSHEERNRKKEREREREKHIYSRQESVNILPETKCPPALEKLQAHVVPH